MATNGAENLSLISVAFNHNDEFTHRLRHVIKELMNYIPRAARNSDAVRELAGYGCLTRMHVVRLLAPPVDNEDHTKDIDFSPSGIRTRWEVGYASAHSAIEQAPWQGEFGPLDDVILHERHDADQLSSVLNSSIATVPGAVPG